MITHNADRIQNLAQNIHIVITTDQTHLNISWFCSSKVIKWYIKEWDIKNRVENAIDLELLT